MILVDELMARLSRRRPVFCSEADFQHELAHEIRRNDPRLEVRLEWPLPAPARGAIDLVVCGKSKLALELKYLCKSFTTTLDGETIVLKQHGAHDQRRYDVCKDVARMERYARSTGFGAGVVLLTNDPLYWEARRRSDTVDAAFDLADLRELAGTLAWHARATPGTVRNREAALEISGKYTLGWRDYVTLAGTGGHFRYLWIPVAEPAS